MGFDLKGFPELERALDRASDVLSLIRGSSNAQAAIKQGLKPLVDDAKGRVHKVSGKLQRGIKAYVKVDAVKDSVAEVGVSYKRSKRAHHAHLVEYGHQNFNQYGGPHGEDTPPHPFWAPAIDSKADDALDMLEEIVSDALGDGFGGR